MGVDGMVWWLVMGMLFVICSAVFVAWMAQFEWLGWFELRSALLPHSK